MTRQELECWLCGPDAHIPTPAEIAAVLGVSLAAIADTTMLRVAERRRAVRFTVAVLRDVFAEDAEVRLWLRAPRVELAGRSAFDFLVAGRTRAVEELVLREWQRPVVARSLAGQPQAQLTA